MPFLNSFLSYLMVFIVFSVVAVGGVFAGKALRQRKDAKAAQEEQSKMIE